MGNQVATLGVQTERSVYYSGETVNGRVYLSVNDKDGIVAQTLNIHFSGREKAVVHYTEERRDRDDDLINEDRYEQNEVDILNFDVPINTPIGGHFQPGQYEFPFQFIVPQDLPSSMFVRSGQSRCEIRYEMTAYLSKNDRSFSVNPFKSNTISSKPLVLQIFGGRNGPVSQHSYGRGPVHFPGHTYPVRCCCCCFRGSMDLSASIDGVDMVPNQNCNVSFRLKNNSRTHVANVVVEVIERVCWRPRFREEATNFTLIRHAIDGKSNSDWLTKQQRIMSTMQEFVSLSPSSARDTDIVTLRIPNGSRDSYSGNMIQVEHFVRVKVVTNGCCLSNPETTVDINVSRPLLTSPSNDEPPPPVPSAPFMDEDEVVVEATALPPGWSPQTNDTFMIPMADVVSSSPGEESAGAQYQNPTVVPLPFATK